MLQPCKIQGVCFSARYTAKPYFKSKEDTAGKNNQASRRKLPEYEHRSPPLVTCQSTKVGAPRLIQPSRLSRRELLAGSAAASLLLPCGCPRPAAAEDWGYGAAHGPGHWGGTCSLGTAQSPIDLPTLAGNPAAQVARIQLNYSHTAQLAVLNTGHGTMQVNVGKGSSCTIGHRTLNLVQWHFHSPSEHAFNSRREAMEVHLVHQYADSGGLAVLGVLLRRGAKHPNPALQFALDNAPSAPRAALTLPDNIDLQALLATLIPSGAPPYYLHYEGSLTTPPCSENVTWYVLAEPGSVADSQVLDFEAFVGAQRTLAMNSRPLQPLNGRLIDVV